MKVQNNMIYAATAKIHTDIPVQPFEYEREAKGKYDVGIGRGAVAQADPIFDDELPTRVLPVIHTEEPEDGHPEFPEFTSEEILQHRNSPWAAGSQSLISQEHYEFLMQFDMGDCLFIKLPVEFLDGSTANKTWWFMHIMNKKDTVVPTKKNRLQWVNKTQQIIAHNGFGDYPGMPFTPIAVKKASEQGPDLWIDPAIIDGPFFMSEKLAQAIIDSPFKPFWKPKPMRWATQEDYDTMLPDFTRDPNNYERPPRPKDR